MFAAASMSIMEVAGHTRQSMDSALSISSAETSISIAHWQQLFHVPGKNHTSKNTDSILDFEGSVAAVAAIIPFNVLYCISQ